MGMSVGPHVGPTWILAGDAGGAINPFNGEGISYAYESGRFAADADRSGCREPAYRGGRRIGCASAHR